MFDLCCKRGRHIITVTLPVTVTMTMTVTVTVTVTVPVTVTVEGEIIILAYIIQQSPTHRRHYATASCPNTATLTHGISFKESSEQDHILQQ